MKKIYINAQQSSSDGSSVVVKLILDVLLYDSKTDIINLLIPRGGQLSVMLVNSENVTVRKDRFFMPSLMGRLINILRFWSVQNKDSVIVTLSDIPVLSRVPQILLLHNSLLFSDAVTWKFPTNDFSFIKRLFFHIKISLLRKVLKFNLRHVAVYVVQSPLMKKRLIENFKLPASSIKVSLMPRPFFDLEKTSPRITSPSSGRFRLIFPAHYKPHKNHGLIMEAVRLYRNELADTDFIFTFSKLASPSKVSLKENIINIPGVSYAEMPKLYKSCDALIFPSLEESFGLPLLEAMEMGLPILAADRPYSRWMIGETGFFFDPYSPSDMVKNLLRLKEEIYSGWKPDWRDALSKFPTNQDALGKTFSKIVYETIEP